VFAGGTAINLLAGTLFFALGRLTGPAYPRLKYFSFESLGRKTSALADREHWVEL
jgi:hypothetical protein